MSDANMGYENKSNREPENETVNEPAKEPVNKIVNKPENEIINEMNIEIVDFRNISRSMKNDIVAMWDENFADSREFADFYFDSVAKENKIVTAKYNEELVGMIHLNPYNVMISGLGEKAYYIVGVAVSKKYRRMGIMKKMMEFAISYMEELGHMFTFLMPENEKYYKGFGFEVVLKTSILTFNNIVKVPHEFLYYNRQIDLKDISDDMMQTLCEKINNMLSDIYDVYSIRDVSYIKKMIKEHTCQNGSVFLIDDNDVFTLYSMDNYDGVAYIDRFELLEMTEAAFIKSINSIIVQAELYGAKEIKMTMASEMLEKYAGVFNDIFSKATLLYNIEKGKGIMAKKLSNTNCHDNEYDIFSKQVFFDEIV